MLALCSVLRAPQGCAFERGPLGGGAPPHPLCGHPPRHLQGAAGAAALAAEKAEVPEVPEALAPGESWSVKMSFLQIYKERIFDLLNPAQLSGQNRGEEPQGLRLRWDSSKVAWVGGGAESPARPVSSITPVECEVCFRALGQKYAKRVTGGAFRFAG